MSGSMVGTSGSAMTSFYNPLAISQSGLEAAAQRINVAANNIANANTDEFVPDRVVSKVQPEGGVMVLVEPGPGPVYLNAGQSLTSHTDLVTELINSLAAEAAFKANATMFRETHQVMEQAVNTLG